MKRTITVTQTDNIIHYIKEHTNYSNKKIKSMIEHKQILLNQKEIKLPKEVHEKDIIEMNTDKIFTTPFSILYEDKDFIAVNKNSGLLTVSTQDEKEETLYHQVYEYLHKKNEMVFVIHRLDKETSGVVVFAKSEKIKKSLQENWNEFVTSRRYMAVVHGKLEKEGKIESFLKEEKNTFVHSAKEGKKAITLFHVLKQNKKYSLVDITLLTGRKNQIRVHMKEHQNPVLGDKKYGIKDHYPRLALHSYELSFYCPITKKEYSFKTDIPKEFTKLF